MKLLSPKPIHIELRPDWKYVSANATDISKTFKRAYAKIAAEKEASEQKYKPNKVREFKQR